ncbi:hypothetical protein LOK49_LG03G01818 [Camellia lanceoleosa]|uniref:Uncharacterized protein n=1 Tax=Camellia lanceoleosa TaxID=1840588 RepID=A0ACC0IH40_9ERIC|nr:hypothetical protein LOK49_LG03G01818 [Camellia lanceoleosa]
MACNNKKPIQNQLVLERGSSNKVKNTSVGRTGYGVFIDLDDSDDEIPQGMEQLTVDSSSDIESTIESLRSILWAWSTHATIIFELCSHGLSCSSSSCVGTTTACDATLWGASAIYSPGVVYAHPIVPIVATPVSAQMLSTSSDNMNQGSTKKFKRLDGVAMQVVNDNAKNYSGLFRRTRRMYFSAADRGEMMSMVYNWPADQVDMIVVTDGSRILGLGDLGLHGIGIAIGKLDLYVAATGINPQRVSSCFT